MDVQTEDKRIINPPVPAAEQDAAADKPPARRRVLPFVIAGLVLLALLVAGFVYWLHARHYETTDDAFIDGYISQVASQVPGRVTRLLIHDNQEVRAGQELLDIDPRDYQERLGQAEAQRGNAAAQLLQAQAQLAVRQAALDQAKADSEVSESDVARTTADLGRYRAINPHAISRQQLDDAVAAERSAKATLAAKGEAVAGAQAQIAAAKAQIAAAEAGVHQADSNLAYAKLQLSYASVTAPVAGQVTKRSVDVGNYVTAGEPLLAIVQDQLWVTANFKETQLALMHPGQHVAVTVDAVPGVVFSAHVDSFQRGTGSVFSELPAENATGNYVKVVQRVPVKIVFDDPAQLRGHMLAPGMSVEPEVTVR